MTEPVAIVLGALIAAIFGFTAGTLNSWHMHRTERRKRNDRLFGDALAYLTRGSQRRNVGLAQLRLYMREPDHDKDLCTEVLIGTAIYLLLGSKQKNKAHERLNLDRIMTMLLKDLKPNKDGTQQDHQKLYDAIKSRFEQDTDQPGTGLRVEKKKLEQWKKEMEKTFPSVLISANGPRVEQPSPMNSQTDSK